MRSGTRGIETAQSSHSEQRELYRVFEHFLPYCRVDRHNLDHQSSALLYVQKLVDFTEKSSLNRVALGKLSGAVQNIVFYLKEVNMKKPPFGSGTSDQHTSKLDEFEAESGRIRMRTCLCRLIEVLCWKECGLNRDILRQHNVGSTLVQLLEDQNHSVRSAAARALQHFVFENRKNANIVYETGGIPILVALVDDPEPTVQLSSLGALANSLSQHQKSRDQLRQSDGIKVLVQCLRQERPEILQLAALAITYALSANSLNRKEFSACNGIPLLLRLLTHPRLSIRDQIIWTIEMALHGSKSNVHEFVSCGGLSMLEELSRRDKSTSLRRRCEYLLGKYIHPVKIGSEDSMNTLSKHNQSENPNSIVSDWISTSARHVDLPEHVRQSPQSKITGQLEPKTLHQNLSSSLEYTLDAVERHKLHTIPRLEFPTPRRFRCTIDHKTSLSSQRTSELDSTRSVPTKVDKEHVCSLDSMRNRDATHAFPFIQQPKSSRSDIDIHSTRKQCSKKKNPLSSFTKDMIPSDSELQETSTNIRIVSIIRRDLSFPFRNPNDEIVKPQL